MLEPLCRLSKRGDVLKLILRDGVLRSGAGSNVYVHAAVLKLATVSSSSGSPPEGIQSCLIPE